MKRARPVLLVVAAWIVGSVLVAVPTAAGTANPNGTIKWVLRHEPRGQSLASAHLPVSSLVGSHWQPVRFARVLRPDPASDERVVVSLIGKRGLNMCVTTFFRGARRGGGCGAGASLNPVAASVMSGVEGLTMGEQIIAGLAADGVQRIELIDARRHHHPVALKDNALFVRVPAAIVPVALAAFDARGRAVGIKKLLP